MWKLIGLAQEVEEPTEIVVETTEACADLGPFCNLLADWTGNEAFAETISWVLGTPVKIVIVPGSESTGASGDHQVVRPSRRSNRRNPCRI